MWHSDMRARLFYPQALVSVQQLRVLAAAEVPLNGCLHRAGMFPLFGELRPDLLRLVAA